MQRSLLQELPPELRSRIYEYVFGPESELPLDKLYRYGLSRHKRDGYSLAFDTPGQDSTRKRSFPSFLSWLWPLLATCHEIQEEGICILLRIFDIVPQNPNEEQYPPYGPYPGDLLYQHTCFEDLVTGLSAEQQGFLRIIGICVKDDLVLKMSCPTAWYWDDRTPIVRHFTRTFIQTISLRQRAFHPSCCIRPNAFVLRIQYDGLCLMERGLPYNVRAALIRSECVFTLDIYLDNAVKSEAELERACKICEEDQEEKVQMFSAGLNKVRVTKPSSVADYQQALRDLQRDYKVWLQHLRTYHSALIRVLLYAWNAPRKVINELMEEALRFDKGLPDGGTDRQLAFLVEKITSWELKSGK